MPSSAGMGAHACNECRTAGLNHSAKSVCFEHQSTQILCLHKMITMTRGMLASYAAGCKAATAWPAPTTVTMLTGSF